MRIRDLPEDERPREKVLERGAAALSDAEILALFFGHGRAGVSAIDLGREMLNRFGGLRNLSRAGVGDLMKIPGVGPAKAAQLAAVIEFGRRLARESFSDQAISSPEDVFALLGPEMQCLAQESVRVILLNHRKKLLHSAEVFRGTGNESFANPSEILRQAISFSAHAIIVVHNHPSGDPTPSRADHDTTRRLQQASISVGIELTDHIIIGTPAPDRAAAYFSFREAGFL